MKYIGRILLLFLLLNGCKKADSFTQFSHEIESEVEIPSIIGINLPFDIPTPEIHTNLEEELELQNSAIRLIEEAQLEFITLTITHPDNKTFKFLNDAEVYIKAEGLEEILVASIHDIPSSIGSNIHLDIVEDNDLSEYLKIQEFTLVLKIVTDEIILQDVTVSIDSSVFIDAKILGV